MRKALILGLILCANLLDGKTQVSISLNTGLVLSIGRDGSFKEPDWGRGHSEGYQFNSSSLKPGALIGFGIKSTKDWKVSPTFSINILWLQNDYNFSGSIYSYPSHYDLHGDLVSKSIYINTPVSIDIKLLKSKKPGLYLIIGLAPSFHLKTKTNGSVIYDKSNESGNSTYTKNDDDISWDPNAVFLSGIFGIGSSFELFNLPMDVQLACVPSFTDLYSLPNLQTTGIYLMVHFQLYAKQK